MVTRSTSGISRPNGGPQGSEVVWQRLKDRWIKPRAHQQTLESSSAAPGEIRSEQTESTAAGYDDPTKVGKKESESNVPRTAPTATSTEAEEDTKDTDDQRMQSRVIKAAGSTSNLTQPCNAECDTFRPPARCDEAGEQLEGAETALKSLHPRVMACSEQLDHVPERLGNVLAAVIGGIRSSTQGAAKETTVHELIRGATEELREELANGFQLLALEIRNLRTEMTSRRDEHIQVTKDVWKAFDASLKATIEDAPDEEAGSLSPNPPLDSSSPVVLEDDPLVHNMLQQPEDGLGILVPSLEASSSHSPRPTSPSKDSAAATALVVSHRGGVFGGSKDSTAAAEGSAEQAPAATAKRAAEMASKEDIVRSAVIVGNAGEAVVAKDGLEVREGTFDDATGLGSDESRSTGRSSSPSSVHSSDDNDEDGDLDDEDEREEDAFYKELALK